MRRVLFIVGWALAGALIWAVVFGTALVLGSDNPDDFFEQATFRTKRVDAVAGATVAAGDCAESKDSKGVTHTHGTSYQVDLAWTGGDGERHTGVMSTCEAPEPGDRVTVWVSSRDAVFNRSPLAMYGSIPIAAVVFAAGAWGWTWLRKDERRTPRPESRRKRLRRLRRAKRS